MNTYLEAISKNIKNKTAKKGVLAEIEAHIEEKKDYYIEIGYGEEEAEAKAIEDMGEPEEVAVSLNGLHSGKWYKNAFSIVSLILLACCFVMSYVVSDNCYYLWSDVEIHHLWVDLLSLGIFTTYVVIFSLSMKYDNKLIPSVYLIASIFLLLTISIAPSFLPVSINEDGYRIFNPLTGLLVNYIKPLVYGCVVIITKGFGEYADTLHGYDYSEMFEFDEYQGFVILIWALFILWALFIILKVLCKERMYYIGIFKLILNVIKYPMIIFCVLSLAFTSSASVYTYVNHEAVIEQNTELRKSLIDFTVNADTKKDYKTLAKELSGQISELNHRFEKTDEIIYQKFNNKLCLSESATTRISSVRTQYFTDISFSYYPDNEYYDDDIIVSKDEIKKLKYGTDIKEFMKSDLYCTANLVEKYSGVVSERGGVAGMEYLPSISFYFTTGNNEELDSVRFLNGKLVVNEAIDKGKVIINHKY